MGKRLEFHLPDIGDFENVDVVEVLVGPGDRVEKEQSLIVLESDKATMEIPSPCVGVVREMRVRVGDQVSEGDLVAILETEADAAVQEPAAAAGAVPEPRPPAREERGREEAREEGVLVGTPHALAVAAVPPSETEEAVEPPHPVRAHASSAWTSRWSPAAAARGAS
jgi:pyruvate/2-oxoglutarate dehydrogenase complex dihydrolipoamide acyltransferase (E2) component